MARPQKGAAASEPPPLLTREELHTRLVEKNGPEPGVEPGLLDDQATYIETL